MARGFVWTLAMLRLNFGFVKKVDNNAMSVFRLKIYGCRVILLKLTRSLTKAMRL